MFRQNLAKRDESELSFGLKGLDLGIYPQEELAHLVHMIDQVAIH
jgi:hypothetical protein